jgi:hypothetical protein
VKELIRLTPEFEKELVDESKVTQELDQLSL